MCQHEKQSNIITCQHKHSEPGQILEKSSIKLLKEVIEDTSSKKSKRMDQKESSSIAEFLAKNKNMNFNIKSNIFKKDILSMNLLQISDLESAQKGKVSEPFWNVSSQKISKRLLSQQQTDFQDLDLNYLNGYFQNSRERLQQKYQERTIYPQTFSKLLQYSLPDTTAEDVTRTRKIRFYPTKNQKQILRKFFGCYRLFYNKAAEYINNDEDYINKFKIPSAITIRDKLMSDKNKQKWIDKRDDSIEDASYDIAQEAIRSCVSNYKTGKTIHKKKYNADPDYRTKIRITLKDATRMCNLTKNNYNLLGAYMRILPTKLNNDSDFKLHSGKKTKRDIRYLSECYDNTKKFGTMKIIRDEYRRYYFCISYSVPISTFRNNDSIVAFDPGYRTFITCVDSYGNKYSIGNDMLKFISTNANRIEQLKCKRNGNRKIRSLRTKVTNYVQDYHRKAAKFIATRYNHVIAPELSSSFIKKHKGAEYINYINFVSHYKFTSKLKLACELYNNEYLYANESYTSRTCCHCGYVNDKYIEKTLQCKDCNVAIDRDINGANNILIRFLTREV